MRTRRKTWVGLKPWKRQRSGDDLALGSLLILLLALGLFILIAGQHLLSKLTWEFLPKVGT